MRAVVVSMIVGAFLCLSSGMGFAQSGIAGVVKDVTGAVLPGVTVEASSPALIEKIRSGATDADGQYKLVDLRPGTYTVTFSLTGFATVKVEAINLPSGFTATVNGEMRVGAVEEAITVTGAAPTVDVKSSTQSTELSKALLDTLPLGRSPHNFAQAIPAVTGVNLGGFATGRDANRLQAYGSSVMEATVAIDGDRINYGGLVGGPGVTTRLNPAMVGEISAVTTGAPAQYQLSGVQMNLIPREGGNTFSGYLYSMWSYDGLQASNVTADLRAQGVTRSGLVKQWDLDPAFGGPVKRDKLWFYGSIRNSKIIQYRPGLYENATPGAWTYTSDLRRPATAEIDDPDYSARLTWQASAKDKIGFFASTQPRTMNLGFELNTVSNEATTVQTYPPNRVLQLVWKRPVTSKLLLDAGWARYDITLFNAPQPGTSAVDPTMIAVTEQSTGLQYRAPQRFNQAASGMATYRGSASYVTGSHYFKAGLTLIQQTYTLDGFAAAPHLNITYRLNRGAPNLLTLNAPVISDAHLKADAGLYAQDQWTVRRLTLNLGLRFDYFNAWNSAETEGASQFVGARSFPGTTNTPNWTDLNPRVAAAFDVFGDSKTALKLSVGRYVIGAPAAAANQASPAANSIQTATRTWTDANHDYVPDCDFNNPAANGECGRLSNLSFGGTDPNVTTVDPAVLHGFDVRPYQWETTFGLERQIATGWSATLSYVRRSLGNFTVTRNAAVPQDAYDPYCISAPVDPRLPGGGGNQICGLYDIKPDYFQILNSKKIVTNADQFGKETQIYNGLDVSTTANLPNAVQLLGGITVGRSAMNTCFIVNSPQDLRFCDVKQPFQPIFKMSAHMPLPWGVDTTVMYQTLPGGQSSISSTTYNIVNGIQANYTALNSEVVPTLQRNLAAGAAATVTIPLITPNTMYTPRQHIVNARVTKSFRVHRVRVVPGIEIDNVLNASTAFSVNNTYGPSWLTVNQIMNPRNVQFNAQVTF